MKEATVHSYKPRLILSWFCIGPRLVYFGLTTPWTPCESCYCLPRSEQISGLYSTLKAATVRLNIIISSPLQTLLKNVPSSEAIYCILPRVCTSMSNPMRSSFLSSDDCKGVSCFRVRPPKFRMFRANILRRVPFKLIFNQRHSQLLEKSLLLSY